MDAVQNVNLNIRVNPNTKKEFEKFCDDVGMSMTTAVNLFMKKTIHEHRIPFEIGYEMPNQTTLDAIREMDDEINDPNLKTYDSFDEILKELNE
jgi:DNA-damage-inducible protein J